MERQLTFIDVDENRLELWLKPDRVQLVVIDSRPELEAGELRRFASVLFAEYVARDLADHLAAARDRLLQARDRACGAPVGDPVGAAVGRDGAALGLTAALDGALRAIDDLAAAVAIPEPLPVPREVDPEPEDGAPVAGEPCAPGEPGASPARPEPIIVQLGAANRPYPSLQATLRAARKRSRRGERAEEAGAGTIRWDVGAAAR